MNNGNNDQCTPGNIARAYATGAVVGGAVGFFTGGGPQGVLPGAVVGGTANALQTALDCVPPMQVQGGDNASAQQFTDRRGYHPASTGRHF